MRLIPSRFIAWGCLLSTCYVAPCKAQSQPVKEVKLTQFSLQSSAVITTAGDSLSMGDYQPSRYWFDVKVPSTVLTGLVANHVYPDPYQGMNNMYIPDASDTFNTTYHLEQYSFLPNDPNPWKKPYWYRTIFQVPASDKGKHFELIFKGINYRAEVWVNGQRIADSAQMAGMFAEYRLDVSGVVHPGQPNGLAVKIYPLDEAGTPSPPQLKALGDFFLNGGPNGNIGKNVTMLCSIGWDWIPEVHDRNMGIWQPVYLRTSGQVLIDHPHMVTDLPSLPDTSVARLTLDLHLINYAAQAQKGMLKVTIAPETFMGTPFSFEKEISLGAGADKQVSLSPADIKALELHHPHLWWPNGYGRPDLYKVRLQVIIGDQVSDDTSFLMGVRTVGSQATDVNGWVRRDFYVNGHKVHLNGGAWVPDMMLNRDSVRYDYELHLCRNANVNLVRIWGGGLGETDDFYTLADRYGLMVWQDFWITGDTQGEFKGSPDYPLQTSVFIRNMLSTIYRIRNHASLLVWTGGNEGHARLELYNAMRDNVAQLDGTRPFIPSSSGFAKQDATWKGSWPDNKPSGVYSGGPYRYLNPEEYYKLVDAGKDWVFKDETGLPSQPPYSTLPKIIPDLIPDTTLPFSLNNTWGYHDACEGAAQYSKYYKNMEEQYGTPVSMQDFSEKMQLLNADGYRGIFEAAGHHLRTTGGVMLWKLNSAFPSVVWQIYDWYLEPNAGYYFMQRAVEPLHVQLNLDDTTVAVVNRTYHPASGLKVRARILDLNGAVQFDQTAPVSVDTTEAKEVLPVGAALRQSPGVHFVELELVNALGKRISSNIYWMAPGRDFKTLSSMSGAKVETHILSMTKTAKEYQFKISFRNVGKQLAFFLNPQILQKGEEVRPAFWSDNYFSLASGEETTVMVSLPIEKVALGELQLIVEGWNTPRKVIIL